MKEVTKEEFFSIINSKKLNVHPIPTGNYPYKTIWKYLDYHKAREVFGVSENGKYYLN